ncbi:hypothetical protein D4A81_09070 [Lachnoanaerobaculum umeaense]|uniref:Uncharacterized protein n=2 Tax=Lachnoanaerobaculum umeaense TaxID=617123 RepID=A0A385Q394_9FIRM|nr:hypothetical protein [Lachnoanaerobaculum umeaense]AYB00088.1 hypothetical protein D4A81_09070 [Lachnoanaerobaculum umeaense]PZW97407.1 hypothetical protein C7439_10921 [Lachnoanaerobaculum umeaense]
MIVHHNNTIIHIVDGPKPALRYKEIHEAIQPGDGFMMKCELFIKENAVPTDVICEVTVKKKYHNWCELKVIEEKEEVVYSKKKKRAIRIKRIERTMSATIGQILTDSTSGVILSSPALSKMLETKTLKELLEDKELGRKLLSKGGFKCLV